MVIPIKKKKKKKSTHVHSKLKSFCPVCGKSKIQTYIFPDKKKINETL